MTRFEPRISPGGLVQNFGSTISRAVIDDDPAVGRPRLDRHRGNQPWQELLLVTRWSDGDQTIHYHVSATSMTGLQRWPKARLIIPCTSSAWSQQKTIAGGTATKARTNGAWILSAAPASLPMMVAAAQA